jgi:hypothetical protein
LPTDDFMNFHVSLIKAESSANFMELSKNLHPVFMKVIMAFTLVISFLSCKGQNDSPIQQDENTTPALDEFGLFVTRIISDSSVFNGFGVPPPITQNVLNGLEKELKSDSARYHFENLSRPLYERENFDRRKLDLAIKYFGANKLYHCLLATSIHWSPDCRIDALEELYKMQVFKLFANYSSEGLKNHKEMEQDVLQFLIYVLENTKWAMSGGENLVIQTVNQYTIKKTLNFIVDGEVPENDDSRYDNSQVTQLKINHWKKGIQQ